MPLADVDTSRRWDTTIWKASPSSIARLAALTEDSKSARAVRSRTWGGVAPLLPRTAGAIGLASCAVIASRRSIARSYAPSTPSAEPFRFQAIAIRYTEPVAWSSAATSVASTSVASGMSDSFGAVAASVGSHSGMMPQPRDPTSAPVRGGIPSIAGAASSSRAECTTSRKVPSSRAPSGCEPIHCACPSRATIAPALEAPTNDQRPHEPPCSADSRMKLP